MFGSGVLCPNAGPVSGRRCVASLCCSPELEPPLSQGQLDLLDALLATRAAKRLPVADAARQLHALFRLAS